MNILCVDQYSELGGAQKMLLDLLPAFSKRGWKTHMVLPGEGPFTNAVQKLGCQTTSFRTAPYSNVRKRPMEMVRYICESPELARRLLRIASRSFTDLIYVNGPRVLPAAAWVARRRSLPLLFHCHHRLNQGSAIRAAGLSLRFAKAQVVACCRYAVEPLQPYVAHDRLQVIYNGIALPLEPPSPTRVRNISRIGVVGRVEREKGQLEFVLAARILSRSFPHLNFSVVGAPLFSDDTYLNQVRSAAADLAISFTGWKENIAEAFSSLDLLVVPSSMLESTPRVIMEAFCSGIPVVAFAVGGVPEVIEDLQTGFLVRENTPEALAERISVVLQMSDEQLGSITENALRTCDRRYNLDTYRHEVCDLVGQFDMAA